MKTHARILAGTALGLLMASAPSIAESPVPTAAPLLFAQANDAETRRLEEERAAEENVPAEEAPEVDDAPAEEPDAPAVEEPEPEAPEAEASEPAAAEERAPAAEDAPAEESVPDEEPASAPAPDAAPADEAPAAEAEPAPREAPAAAQDPAPAEAPTPEPAPETPAEEEAAPAEEAKPANRPARRAPETGEEEPSRPRSSGSDADTEAAPESEDEADALPENAAPVLDSAKEAPAADGENRRAGRSERARPAETAAEEAAPPPTSDEDAQAPGIRDQEIRSITATEGRRMERDEVRRERSQRQERRGPEGSEVVRESEGRVIFQFNNETFVESNDLPRLSRDARDVYYDELPRGMVRETIVRPNGAQIVTLRNRQGEIVRRSRITPEGREIVLTYVAEDRWDSERDWRDPGDELPPLRLRIPVREYILDAEQVGDEESYYEFLDQPPVEQARRLYSVDEVKRSARLRDTIRRVDLDTITFATGSADIARSEVDELEGIASAMLRLLDENPAETFLIEGHTDAVGSDIANLGLSDARAESAADALTEVFGIPPENLVTQGYGERYLKVATEGPSRENRRVAIRRITPLVTPVASAQ